MDRRFAFAMWVLILGYPALFAWQGIDFTDTGVLLSMHQQFFSDPVSVEFRSLMWLANLINAVWLTLTESFGLVGARLGSVVGYGLCAVAANAALRRHVPQRILLPGLLLTMVLILRGGSHFLSYNALTSLFFLLSALALVRGVPAGSRLLMYVAGFLIGASVFLRLPNAVGAALALGIPFHALLCGGRLRDALPQTVRFAAGWVAGLGSVVAAILLCGHGPVVWASIVNEMGPSPTAHYDKFYVPGFMALRLVTDHAMALGLAGVVVVAVTLLSRAAAAAGVHARRVMFAFVSAGCLAFFAAFPFIYGFSVITYTWAGICYVAAGGVAAGCCGAPPELRLAAFLAALQVFLVPLGSGNGMNNAVFAVWLATPIVFLAARQAPAPRLLRRMDPRGASFAVALGISVLVVCAVYNAFVGVYRDCPNRFRLTAAVNHPMLRGIRTTPERARVLNELLAELDSRVQPNEYMIAFEHVPLLHFITRTRPYARGPWPLVKRPEVLGRALEQAELDGLPLPVVVRANGDPCSTMWPAGSAAVERSQRMRHIEGRKYMDAFLLRHAYRVAWSNEGFEILVPGGEAPDGR